MTYLSLGQVNIPIAWLAFVIAILYSDFRNRHKDGATNKLIEHLLYTYIFIWKFSYIIFSGSDFFQAPLSLIYFDGGLKGHLSALVAVAFLLYRKRKVFDWEAGWMYWVRLAAVYQLIFYSFQEQWFVVGMWIFTLILIERIKSQQVLLVQFFLLMWLDGFISSFTLFHGAVLLTVYFRTKHAQYLAGAGLLSLVAIMLMDVEENIKTTTRAAIDLPTTTGEQYRLSEQEQSLTVVNFFATWCPPCKAEMPHLQSFGENLPRGVALLGINLTARDNGEEALADFMKTYGVTYPILRDEDDGVGTAFQVKSIPTTVVLNAQGEELERIVGPVSEEGLRQLMRKYQPLLSE
ncbi:TlpA family protein disulfide reductase [Solibacillus ferritrahens]|uniref:TlpA family protein disulfide reductase n=1 Tax=Solibacillus ferritrahens TaxID=3098620 RepID=UPI00300BC37C